MRLTSFCTITAAGVFAATAAMAAVTQVNVADPNATSRVAKVEVGNRLAVQEVSPSTFFHASKTALTSGSCVTIATPPAGKALIIRQVRINVYVNPNPGSGQSVLIYPNSICGSGLVGDINPPTIGLFTSTFDPGVAIPNGSVLSVFIGGSLTADVFVDGYKVDASVAPEAGGQTLELSGKSRQIQ